MVLPDDWAIALAPFLASPAWAMLQRFVAAERVAGPIWPTEDQVFAALSATPFDAVRVVLLGQDPYHGVGQACGLAFSVPHGVRPPPSLRNLLRELETDLGIPPPGHGALDAWAAGGVLLLNATLTVRQDQPASHQGQGWEELTDAVIDALDRRDRAVVFVLLGSAARKKAGRINNLRHRVIEGVHPSPLSAHRGFFGSRLFSRIDRALVETGGRPMEWGLPRG